MYRIANMAQVEYNVWLDKGRFDDVEHAYQEHLAQLRSGGCSGSANKSSPCKGASSTTVTGQGGSTGGGCKLAARVDALEIENKEFRSVIESLTRRLAALENGGSAVANKTPEISKCPPIKAPAEAAGDVEDDFELFGSDDEAEMKEPDAEADRVRQERVAAYEAKKAKKPVLVAKSNIILDVKPWDDETDMAKLEECVRSIEMDGLLWGASKLVPLAYGIKKLQISCVVEDDKVSTDDLEEKLLTFEDYIQSMDIAAFNKI
jgi:elongation factor 1-delta